MGRGAGEEPTDQVTTLHGEAMANGGWLMVDDQIKNARIGERRWTTIRLLIFPQISGRLAIEFLSSTIQPSAINQSHFTIIISVNAPLNHP
jgi:hypothetical protein